MTEYISVNEKLPDSQLNNEAKNKTGKKLRLNCY